MEQHKRILIVGGVAGGASAAARARRLNENAEIIIFERGEHISFANCGLPYHIAGTITDRNRLLIHSPQSMSRRFNIKVKNNTEVERIDPASKRLIVRDLKTDKVRTEGYDDLVLSPGAAPFTPDIDGVGSEGVFVLRNIADMDKINAAIEKRKNDRVLVIGGGYIGLEMTESLRKRGLDVTLLQLPKQVMNIADPEMVAPLHEHLRLHGVDLRLGTSVRKFTETDNGLKAQLTTGESIDCGLAVMAVGVRAEVKLASEAGLKIGQTGGIAVDEQMRTSDKNIYAIGDAAEIENFVTTDKALIPLAGPANRQGRIAANNIAGKKSTYKKTQGTSICKVFDLTIAMTGLSEKSLKRSQTKYEKIYVHPSNHAGYYPGASPISLKLLFDSEDGTILGAQALGAEGVDKRIDVLATAMRAKMKVNDLADLELCYAPQFGSAKDPVNYAGFVAGNIINGDLKVCHFEDIQNTNGDQILLDVRTPTEFKLASIEGAINIGVDELRDRLGELDKEKEILVFCQVGLRGYLAYRILVQNGFKCRNLTGGYKTYKAFQNNGQSTPAQQKNKETIAVNKTDIKITKELDACGLQCPGPIMKIQQEIEKIQAGQTICVTASDPGFSADVAAWCKSTGNKLAGMDAEAGNYRAIIEKGKGQQTPESMPKLAKDKSIIVFSGDFDKAFASFIIANGAAAMGSNVTMFFTFWGLNVLRKKSKVKVEKNLVEKMFGWMMPRGADKLKLSKMNMGNMGLAMIKGIMKNKNVASLPELIESAKQNGVKLVACAMSMDLMGIRKEEMIEGVELGGVASYLETAENSGVNLFI